jgi:hypothetical protein
MGVIDLKQKKGLNKYKVKYNKEEIDLIFMDDMLFKMFKK